MTSELSPQAQREKLLSAIKLAESEHGSLPVDTSHLQNIINNIHELYSVTYRLPLKLPITVLSLSDQRDPLPFTRASIQREVAVIPGRDGKISGVRFGSDRILLSKGDPSLVYPKNTQGVFRAIIAHEYVHGQAKNIPLVGVDNPQLLPRDVRYGGGLLFVTGFKAVALGPNKEFTKPITQTLDEFIAQYLAMSLCNSFEDNDPVLDGFTVHGKGIASEYVSAAYLLNDIFRTVGIDHTQVEDYHFRSDIRGFLELLEKSHPDLGRSILKVGLDSHLNVALNKLEALWHPIINKKS